MMKKVTIEKVTKKISILSAPASFLNDFHGNKSPKRFWGNKLLKISVFLGVTLYVISLALSSSKYTIPDNVHSNIIDIVSLFFYTGGGLLFGGVFESFGKRR